MNHLISKLNKVALDSFLLDINVHEACVTTWGDRSSYSHQMASWSSSLSVKTMLRRAKEACWRKDEKICYLQQIITNENHRKVQTRRG